MTELETGQPLESMDFTTMRYKELLRLAKRRYRFATYAESRAHERVILWRHDVDYSLNRALRLAEIEHDEGVRTTYFINPHCAFYNALENGQQAIIGELVRLGHDLGVHLDAAYHGIVAESGLDAAVKAEARFFQEQFGVQVVAFSFHNPTPLLLACDEESYGGLLNCYSKLFKSSFGYCSDSNGHWRFRNLQEVLESSTDDRLQVLTHPGWWQELPMSPRERIFRCVDGRAAAVMGEYDRVLNAHGRSNIGTLDVEFDAMRRWLGKRAAALDLRWMGGEFCSVFVDVCRLLEGRLASCCRIGLSRLLRVPIREARALFAVAMPQLPLHRVLAVLLGKTWAEFSGFNEDDILYWQSSRDQVVRGRGAMNKVQCEHGIRFIVALAATLTDRVHAASGLIHGQAKASPLAMNERQPRQFAIIEWASQNVEALGIDRESVQRLGVGVSTPNSMDMP